MESIDDLTSTNGRARTKRANIRPLLTPRAIARGACGHSPYYYGFLIYCDSLLDKGSPHQNIVLVVRTGRRDHAKMSAR
jgi:hypothetical protein